MWFWNLIYFGLKVYFVVSILLVGAGMLVTLNDIRKDAGKNTKSIGY